MFLLEAPGENRFPCCSQLLEAACIPWLLACPPSSKPARAAFSCCVSLALTLLSPFFISGDPCDDIRIIQGNLPVSRSLRSCRRSPFHHVRSCIRWLWGSSHGHLCGPFFCLPPIPQTPQGASSGALLTHRGIHQKLWRVGLIYRETCGKCILLSLLSCFPWKDVFILGRRWWSWC